MRNIGSTILIIAATTLVLFAAMPDANPIYYGYGLVIGGSIVTVLANLQRR